MVLGITCGRLSESRLLSITSDAGVPPKSARSYLNGRDLCTSMHVFIVHRKTAAHADSRPTQREPPLFSGGTKTNKMSGDTHILTFIELSLESCVETDHGVILSVCLSCFFFCFFFFFFLVFISNSLQRFSLFDYSPSLETSTR